VLPPYVEWSFGDLPLLTVVIDPDAQAILALAMTPFDDRATVTHGTGDSAPTQADPVAVLEGAAP
jgi:hypothetical protein